MADDKSNRGSPDRDRINLSQEHEVRYWSERFGVSPEQLKEAVRQAGPTVDAVEKQLRRR
jgi:hypothetical protein